jgi:hypothetical protein
VEPDNTSALEVFRLVDKLEDLIHNAKPVPLTIHVRIDRREAYALLDELRVAVVTLAKQGTSGS